MKIEYRGEVLPGDTLGLTTKPGMMLRNTASFLIP